MSAIRVARGFTKRDFVVKFEGCYHGHADHLLVKAGSGAATFGVPDSAGVPAGIAQSTLTLAYNDAAALRTLFADRGKDIAAVIVEPVAGNMGCVVPAGGFLEAIIELCQQHGALSIFDEDSGRRNIEYGPQCLPLARQGLRLARLGLERLDVMQRERQLFGCRQEQRPSGRP